MRTWLLRIVEHSYSRTYTDVRSRRRYSVSTYWWTWLNHWDQHSCLMCWRVSRTSLMVWIVVIGCSDSNWMLSWASSRRSSSGWRIIKPPPMMWGTAWSNSLRIYVSSSPRLWWVSSINSCWVSVSTSYSTTRTRWSPWGCCSWSSGGTSIPISTSRFVIRLSRSPSLKSKWSTRNWRPPSMSPAPKRMLMTLNTNRCY